MAVDVEAPMVVGFFPARSQARADSDGGAYPALDHFLYALQETESCLERAGIEVRAVFADRILFRDGQEESELSLAAGSNESIGCYLVAPGREPRIVRATVGPSALIILCPSASSAYFDAPECCPEGFACTPDEGNDSGELETDG